MCVVCESLCMAFWCCERTRADAQLSAETVKVLTILCDVLCDEVACGACIDPCMCYSERETSWISSRTWVTYSCVLAIACFQEMPCPSPLQVHRSLIMGMYEAVSAGEEGGGHGGDMWDLQVHNGVDVDLHVRQTDHEDQVAGDRVVSVRSLMVLV